MHLKGFLTRLRDTKSYRHPYSHPVHFGLPTTDTGNAAAIMPRSHHQSVIISHRHQLCLWPCLCNAERSREGTDYCFKWLPTSMPRLALPRLGCLPRLASRLASPRLPASPRLELACLPRLACPRRLASPASPCLARPPTTCFCGPPASASTFLPAPAACLAASAG